ncbi:MAG: cytochrome c [Chitinophagaceae bacterium]|nr:cytochrome c [Chitinophagaceae bacterium]MCW5929044.1 cytochrome c [Chitinophagaceae bacterium]
MKKSLFALSLMMVTLLIGACGGGSGSESGNSGEKSVARQDPSSYDPTRGEGKFDESNITAGPLDKAMAEQGKGISATKCNSCHKMSDERLVGPGWKGVTERRTLHWLMNFITNPDPMIDKDPEVQAQLELCLVRMPNQNMKDDEARSVVEFMRQNDGVQ